MNSLEMTCISFRVHTSIVISCFLNSKAICEAQAGYPVDQSVDCLAFSVKTLDVFPGGLIRLLDDGQEVDGVFGVVNARARDRTRRQRDEPLTR
ncbi:hypothetical protein PIB30_091246 [Stylosanthes scabra]|uniref:Uncharacterized protein n=1 Tax=Stylosanthes scabra TaxID=79078 RepID=A0ABU6ZTA7_9FABA|nr:hypothetical protein [Stylosanthes scabra]